MKPGFRSRALTSLLRTFFRLLYHELAWSYDLVAALVSVGKWKSWVLSILPDLQKGPILEIGHGPGHLQLALLRQGYLTFGLDRSRQMGRLAFSRVKKKGFTPALVNGYAQLLPFPDAAFQAIVSTFPSEYIFDPATLAELFRLLAPGGRLVILPVAWITGTGALDRAAAWLFRFTGQAPDWVSPLGPRLEAAGFRVRLEFRQLPGSRLAVFIAHKPA
jgi:ubiquinone/menaquinone biosynthesis C-methylase UbiE